jgi:hypothetical protein
MLATLATFDDCQECQGEWKLSNNIMKVAKIAKKPPLAIFPERT